MSGVNYRLIVQSPATWGSFHCDFTGPSGAPEAGAYYCTGVVPGNISARSLSLSETGQYSGVLTFGKLVTGDIKVTVVEEPTIVTTVGTAAQVPLTIPGGRVRMAVSVQSGIFYRILVQNPPNTTNALGVGFDPLGQVAFPDMFLTYGMTFSSGSLSAYSFVPNQTGTYSIAFEFDNPAVTGKLNVKIIEEKTLEGTVGKVGIIPLTSPGDKAHVSIPFQSGVSYTIKLQIPPHTDLLDIRVLDPLGRVVDGFNSGSIPVFTKVFTPNQTGSYTFEVSFQNPAVTGKIPFTISGG